MAQLRKNPPAMWETWVRFLGWEDPQEKGKRVPTSVFWLGECRGLYSPWGLKESDMTEWLSLSFTFPKFYFSIMPSRFIHAITNSKVSFLSLSLCVCLYTYHTFLIRSSIDGHFGCYHVLTIVNNAAINMAGCRYLFDIVI